MIHTINLLLISISISYKETLIRSERLHVHILIIAMSSNLLAESNELYSTMVVCYGTKLYF